MSEWTVLERPSAGRIIRSTWGQGVVDNLNYLYQRLAPFYGGYLYGNIIPAVDKFYDIGTPDAKIRRIHAESGYFDYAYIKNLYTGDIFLEHGWRLFEKRNGIYLEKVPEGHVYKILLERVK